MAAAFASASARSCETLEGTRRCGRLVFSATQTSVGTMFGRTAGTKRNHRRLGHVNLSPQQVSDILPLLKAADGLFEGVEYIHHLPKTLQVAEQEGDVERTEHDAGDCSGPVNSDRC
jgi:hypothetical protein